MAGLILACSPLGAIPPAEPLPSENSPPPIRGNRLIASSSNAVAQRLEVLVTSPVTPGDTASARVMAAAGSRCTIEVTYRSGPSEAQGLDPAGAGEDGSVSWTWIVGINTTLGDWVVGVECIDPDGAVSRGHARLSVAVE